jgi:Protein of unknown function (DUF1194)
MRSRWFAAPLAVALGMPLAASAGSDVALVLAVDASGSVDDNRFRLQREGIAAALDSDELAAVIAMGANQTIEVAVIEWAEEQHVVVPWTVLRRQDELTALASRVRAANRSWVHTKTDPGGGIAAADHLLSAEPLAPDRHVIDVSGDGRQNTGELPTTEARDVAVSHAVTVNGLPITSGNEPELDDWYRINVIGGPGSFPIVANGYEAFAAAFRQKLMLEIAGLPPTPKLAQASRRS